MSTRTRQDWILWAQLGCALVATAHAEYTLVSSLGQHWLVAGAVTGALDLYVVRALQKHKDVLPAVLVMVAANVVSILVAAQVVPVHWAVLAAVGALAPLLVWRGHRLRVHEAKQAQAAGAVSAPASEPGQPCPHNLPTWACPDCAPPAAPEWIPDVLAEQVHPSAPVPGLSADDAVHLGEARAYLEECALTDTRPSVRGLKAFASVGQARAERLLTHLGVRS